MFLATCSVHFLKSLTFPVLGFILITKASAFPEIQPDFQELPVISMEVGSEKVWVKRSGPEKIGIKGCIKKALAMLIPIPTLRPTYYCSQGESFNNEVMRIELLSKSGVRVPHVLKRTNEWIVLSDLGPTFDSLIKKSQNEDERKSLIHKATLGLAQLHKKGQYHGRGVLRDMVLTPEGHVGFIDFEENPQGPLVFKQARDLLMHLYALAQYSEDPALIKTSLQVYEDHGPKVPYWIAINFIRITSPLIKLLKFAPLGRDGLRLLKVQAYIENVLE